MRGPCGPANVSCVRVRSHCRSLTRLKLPFPLSLTLRRNDSSTPVVGSVRVRKAWWGRVAFFPSTVVSWSFSESVAPRDTDFESGDVALSLKSPSVYAFRPAKS